MTVFWRLVGKVWRSVQGAIEMVAKAEEVQHPKLYCKEKQRNQQLKYPCFAKHWILCLDFKDEIRLPLQKCNGLAANHNFLK